MKKILLFLSLLVLLPACEKTSAPWAPVSKTDSKPGPYYGFTGFPYDATLEAVGDPQNGLLGKVYEINFANSNLFVLWEDNCVPWVEMFEGSELNPKTLNDWTQIKASLELGNFDGEIMVALAPTTTDRTRVNADCWSIEDGGAFERIESKVPGFSSKPLNDPVVMDLYLKYVKKSIEFFNPKFVNLAIELGYPVIKDKQAFSEYTELHKFLWNNLKRDYPDVLLGLHNSAYILMSKDSSGEYYSEKLRELNTDFSDYLGVGYYPNSGKFFEIVFDTDPVADGQNSWQEVLNFTENYAKSLGDKGRQIAILDTGMPSTSVDLNPYVDIQVRGSDDELALWVKDLITHAKSENYILVNWWNSCDFDPLWDKAPGDITNVNDPQGEAKAIFGIWKNMGLWEIPVNYPANSTPTPKAGMLEWEMGWGY